MSKAAYYLSRWSQADCRSHEDLDAVQSTLSLITAPHKAGAEFKLQKAVVLVAQERNFQAALKLIQKFKPQNQNVVWHADMAFIKAAMENYSGAINHYRAIYTQKLTTPAITIAQIEDFCLWYHAEHPDDFFSLLILGLVNDYLKGDQQMAIADYNSFLTSANGIIKNHDKTTIQARIRILKSQI